MATPIDSLGLVPGQNLSDKLFSTEEIQAAELLLQQYLQDNFPTLDHSGISTLFDINVRPRAITHLLSAKGWRDLMATQSLKGVIDNPELANDAIVDAILSNDGITRRLGAKATGRIRVNVSQKTVYSITSQVKFASSSGLSFLSDKVYRVTPTPTEDNDLQLFSTDRSDRQWFFLVPVKAAVSGLRSQLSDGVAVTVTGLPSIISAETFGNFQGGANDETNLELIARIPEAKSVKNQVNPISIRAVLKDAFPEVLDVSVQRMNDPAMSRNAHNLLGMKVGGYADIYCRTALAPSTDTISKTARLVDVDGVTHTATYEVKLLRTDFAGHYFVRSVRPQESDLLGSYNIIKETKSFEDRVDSFGNALGTSRPNRLKTVQEAVYSRYQTNTVLFQVEYDSALGTTPDTQFSTSLGVTLEVVYMPWIQEMQEFVNDRERGVVGADYLVRAAIPCFVRFDPIRVEASEGVDATDIRLAVHNYINNLKMSKADRLRIDEVVSVIKSVPGVRYVRLPIRAYGDIYAPNGTTYAIRGDSELSIPQVPSLQLAPETVAFVIELPDIPIALIQS